LTTSRPSGRRRLHIHNTVLRLLISPRSVQYRVVGAPSHHLETIRAVIEQGRRSRNRWPATNTLLDAYKEREPGTLILQEDTIAIVIAKSSDATTRGVTNGERNVVVEHTPIPAED